MENGQAHTAETSAPRLFTAAMARITATTGLVTQVQLAARLDIKQSSISDAKRRDSIPETWLVKLLLNYGLSPRWILTGEGAPYLRDDPDRDAPAHLLPPQPAPDPEPTVAELVEYVEARRAGQ